MKIVTLFKLIYLKYFGSTHREKDYSSFVLAERLANIIYPKFSCTDYAKIWLKDHNFFEYYEFYEKDHNPAFVGKYYRSADRKYFLNSLLSLVEHLPGDTAECGVYYGATSHLICESIKNTAKTHYAFDSFEGLSRPSTQDGEYWHSNDLTSNEDSVRQNLFPYSHNLKICKGWIPDSFQIIGSQQFCFLHIDVDLYQPTLDALQFFYPRMVKQGIIICDDYGSEFCPGAKKAFDEYFSNKPEQIVHVPTCQAFIIKQ
ncbi:MAG: methyltransferase [Symploca sp. SIO2D2]|nr:methyltransferase [Symploca sp. SIO2D2]